MRSGSSVISSTFVDYIADALRLNSQNSYAHSVLSNELQFHEYLLHT
jgi:hypothetical protein